MRRSYFGEKTRIFSEGGRIFRNSEKFNTFRFMKQKEANSSEIFIIFYTILYSKTQFYWKMGRAGCEKRAPRPSEILWYYVMHEKEFKGIPIYYPDPFKSLFWTSFNTFPPNKHTFFVIISKIFVKNKEKKKLKFSAQLGELSWASWASWACSLLAVFSTKKNRTK